MTDSYWDAGDTYDPEAVRFFDVAHEGAQVRALIPEVDRLSSALRGAQLRSAVIIPTDDVARACAHFVAGEQTILPVMVADGHELPRFVGALDMVIVVGERSQADPISQQLITAAGRGATTVLIAPGRGPLVEDAPKDTLILAALPTAAGSSPARYIAGLQTVFASLTQPPEVTQGYLAGIAGQLDEELECLSPQRGVEINPGRQLRQFARDAHVIHSGGALAHVIGTVWAAGGLSGTVVEPDLVNLVVERRAPAPSDDPFFDPFLDGPPSVATKVIFWGAKETPSLPNSLGVAFAKEDAHPLQLIVRAYAATSYDG